MQAFKRRIYGNFGEMMADLIWPLRHRAQMRQAMRSGLVSPQFRERLMMAVTAVNQCRYCATFHTYESERVGLDNDEIRELLAGDLAHAPEEELPALLYAQHYAEHNGRPDPITRQSLKTTYGPARADAIETVLRLIRMGNLLGNSTDWLLHKVSFGYFGGN
ncbi:MAG: carboxymuconolactone decarboxylase family protein [Anaerolineaceae bacterium]|nr:carboxymuconolactone decarboxylase family protein [Anaerolineaceae bacterium]